MLSVELYRLLGPFPVVRNQYCCGFRQLVYCIDVLLILVVTVNTLITNCNFTKLV